MLCREPGSRLLVIVASAALSLAASALPAAGFTVAITGTTTKVTQTDTNTLYVSRSLAGDIEVSDGGPVSTYPPATNLVVRGSIELTTSFVNVILDSALPGTLTLDLPGGSDVTVRGGTVHMGALKVKGSDAAVQTVRLGAVGSPVTIDRDVKLDLRDGNDQIAMYDTVSIAGSLVAKGVNYFEAIRVEVGGSFSLDVKRESHPINFYVADELRVAKSLTVIGGSGADFFRVDGGRVERNATFKMGPGGERQEIFSRLTTGGNFTAVMGESASNVIGTISDVAGSVNFTMLGERNVVTLARTIGGSSIKYRGGPGRDDVSIYGLSAPNATTSIQTGAGSDSVRAQATILKRLRVDLGADTDVFDWAGAPLPPQSTIKGVP